MRHYAIWFVAILCVTTGEYMGQTTIAPLGGNAFAFTVGGKHANLTGIAPPVTVALTIGNDCGKTLMQDERDQEAEHHEQD